MPQTVARTSDAAIVEQRNRDLLRNGQGDIPDRGTIDQLRRLRGTLLRTLARAKTTRAAR